MWVASFPTRLRQDSEGLWPSYSLACVSAIACTSWRVSGKARGRRRTSAELESINRNGCRHSRFCALDGALGEILKQRLQLANASFVWPCPLELQSLTNPLPRFP